MKVGVISDLHVEFMSDTKDMIPLLPECDLLLVAGDFCCGAQKREALRVLGDNCNQAVLVMGNHDYWETNIMSYRPREVLSDVCPSNVHILDGSYVVIDGYEIFGATLWFGDHPNVPVFAHQMNDFSRIEDFWPGVIAVNQMHRSMLAAKRFDIVVTHHMPLPLGGRHGGGLDLFYYTDMSNMMEVMGPKLWAFGHTHKPEDMEVFNTRVVSNPYGYHGFSVNEEFRDVVIDMDLLS